MLTKLRINRCNNDAGRCEERELYKVFDVYIHIKFRYFISHVKITYPFSRFNPSMPHMYFFCYNHPTRYSICGAGRHITCGNEK
jgi:hypothetical protein